MKRDFVEESFAVILIAELDLFVFFELVHEVCHSKASLLFSSSWVVLDHASEFCEIWRFKIVLRVPGFLLRLLMLLGELTDWSANNRLVHFLPDGLMLCALRHLLANFETRLQSSRSAGL